VRKASGVVYLYFFYGGNILEFPSDSSLQREHDWTLSYLSIPLSELSQNECSQNVYNVMNQIQEHRQMLAHDQEGVFRMRSTMFTLSQEWQMDFSVSINKD
jgi:hypothetical protein